MENTGFKVDVFSSQRGTTEERASKHEDWPIEII